MFRHVLRFFAACALVTPAFFATHASAQSDDEQAGHSRGGYAWGEERREESAAGPARHRFGHVYVSLGAGGTVRIIEYDTLDQGRFAPTYLQLRGGYFFEGEGMLQHGVVLGLATNLGEDGGPSPHGVSLLQQWAIAPAYMLRITPDGDLGDWFSATARLGVPLSVGEQFSWGLELGVGMLLKPWNGFGFYGEIDLSTYFAEETHPLISFEIGIAIDLELLP